MADEVNRILWIRFRNIDANSVLIFPQKNYVPRKLKPSSIVPFRQNPDFADRNILTEIYKKRSKLAPRAALFNLKGVRRRLELLNVNNQELLILWKRYRYVYEGHESLIQMGSG